MTKEQLQWAMYEAYARELLGRIEAQEAEIARLGTMAEQARADAVTRAAADEKRIEALRHECERWKTAYSDHCALLDVIHASLGINKGDNVIGEIDRIHKARIGLQTQVQDLRAALAKEQELHAATALRLSTEAAKLVERKHPVKVGEWVRRTDAECESIHWGLGVVAQVTEVYTERYTVTRPEWNGYSVPWAWEYCTPCDPPAADHDTPEGKDVAESVIRDDRKAGPMPGDTVRLVRVPTQDEYPHDTGKWEPNWGGVGDYMRVHHVGNNISGTRIVRAVFGLEWPVSCIEVVRTEPDEIKVGDVGEVFQATGDITALSDIGLRGTVIEIELEDNTVRINSLAQNKDEWVDMCDVRKVTT